MNRPVDQHYREMSELLYGAVRHSGLSRAIDNARAVIRTRRAEGYYPAKRGSVLAAVDFLRSTR